MGAETVGHDVIGIHTREDARAYANSMRKKDDIQPGGDNINAGTKPWGVAKDDTHKDVDPNNQDTDADGHPGFITPDCEDDVCGIDGGSQEDRSKAPPPQGKKSET